MVFCSGLNIAGCSIDWKDVPLVCFVFTSPLKKRKKKLSDPQSWNLFSLHLPDSDQIVDKVPGGVGLSILLAGGVSHPHIGEAIHPHLQEQTETLRESLVTNQLAVNADRPHT